MTGIMVRIQRDGGWQNLEIDELTDEELDRLPVALQQPEAALRTAKMLAKWVRDNVREQAS